LWAALAFAPMAHAQGEQDGEALIATGNELLEGGKFSAAAQQFSRAMRSDTLSNAQIARALYLRGVALKGDGKPAQAIADLDSALWLQGLSSKDLARAYLARGEAYQQVGMGDLAGADLQRAKEVDPNAAPVVARAAPAADSTVGAFSTQVQSQTQESASRARPDATSLRAQLPGFPNVEDERPFRQPTPPQPAEEKQEQVASFQTEVKSDARPEPKTQPVPGFRTSIMPEENRTAAPPPRPAPAAQPAPPPAAAPSQWSTSVSDEKKEESSGVRSSVSNFFSGIWGGDKKEEAAGQPAAAPEQPSSQSWSQSTQVASAEGAPSPRAAASGSGGYKIQLASLRTEEEAQAAWQQISSRHGSLLAGHPHAIEKTTVGNLGTFYRIQIGPFADKSQSAQLCKSLQSSGVNCFVVAR